MALVHVTVVKREGDKPRGFRVDDFVGDKGEEIRNGASLIASLKRQQGRGELFSVTVAPFAEEVPPPSKRAGRKTEAATEA